MASQAALELLIQLDAKNAAQQMDDLGEKGGGFGDAIKNGAALAGGALLGLGGILVGATKAAADDNAERERLNQTLKNSLPNWDGNASAIDNLIKKGQDLAFTDTDVRNSLELLVTQTGDLTTAQGLQATAMDLARAKGIDLQAATKLVAKADDESYAALGKLGIQIDDHATKEEALQQIRAATAGQAETYANSTSGTITRLQNSLGEAFETVGAAILPLVSGPLQDLANWFSSPDVQAGITTIANGIGTVLSGAFNALKTVIDVISPVISTLFTYISDNAGTIGVALGAMAGVILITLIPSFVAWATAAGAAALATITALAPVLVPIAAIGAAAALLKIAWDNNFLGIQDTLTNAWNAMSPVFDAIKAAWDWLVGVQPPPNPLADLTAGVSAYKTELESGKDPVLAFQDTLKGLSVDSKISADAIGAFTDMLKNGADPTTAATTVLGGVKTAIDAAGASAETNKGFLQGLGDMFAENWQKITTDFPGWLGDVAKGLWDWLTQTASDLKNKLVNEWIPAVWNWVTNTKDGLPAQLANIATALWTWLSATAKDLGTKLVNEWIPKVWEWITGEGGVVSTIGTKLGEIATAVWTWVTNTAKDFGDKLINEWIPKFWEWITGPTGVVATIGTKLAEVWTAITTWIGTTASDILTAVGTIGGNIIEGIKTGISNGWDAFVSWVQGLLSGLLSGVLAFFGIKSPSTVMRDQVGVQLVAGMKQGWDSEWPTLTSTVSTAMQGLCDADGIIQKPLKTLIDADVPTIMHRLTDADGVIAAPIKGLVGTDGPVATAMKLLCDADGVVQKPLKQMIDVEIPGFLASAHSGLMAVGGSIADAVGSGFIGAFFGARDAMLAAINSVFDGLWGEAQKRAAEIWNLMQNGTAGNGSGYGYGGNTATGGTGYGGATPMASGGIVTRPTFALVGEAGPEAVIPLSRLGMGGGGNTINLTINAGIGADARSISEAAIEAIEYALGDRVAIRRGTRG